MDKDYWDNKTTNKRNDRSNFTYGLPNNQTAVSFLKTHTLHHCPESNSREILIYLTFATFDGIFVVMENER